MRALSSPPTSPFTAVWGNLPDTAGTYPITVADPANGAVSVSLPNASEGAVITVTAKPDEGYVLAYVTVDGSAFPAAASPCRGTPSPSLRCSSAQGLPFTDVAYGDWFYDEVAYVYANGLMEGVSDTAFEPGGGPDPRDGLGHPRPHRRRDRHRLQLG